VQIVYASFALQAAYMQVISRQSIPDSCSTTLMQGADSAVSYLSHCVLGTSCASCHG
jgi:hypothetical protein